MGNLDVTKNLSLIQIGCVSRQAGVDVPVTGVPICFGARAAKSAVLWLILCVAFGFWISPERASAAGPETATADGPERATALGSKSGAALVRARLTNSSGFREGWAVDLPMPNAMLPGGGNGILESAGVALFVSGLSPYLLQGLPQQPDNYACLREPDNCQLAGEQRPFPAYLELFAGLLLCGLIYWGSAAWMARR
jgi:hypothetical protein